MEALLKLFDELIAVIGNARNEVTRMLAGYKKVNEELAEKRSLLKTDREHLDQRAKEISEIENIAALDKANKVTLKEIAEKKDALVQAQHDFDKYALDKKKEISEGMAKNETEGNDNKKEAEFLRKMRATLEKEKEEYKDKIAKHLVDKVT